MYDNLINELIENARLYYQTGRTRISDEQYDTYLEWLESLIYHGKVEVDERIDELFNLVAAGTAPQGSTAQHDTPMLSLAKAKDEKGLQAYYDRLVKAGATGFKLEMKLDGMALSAKYVNGKLSHIATRGDGFKGELLNHLINDKNISIVGLPKEVDGGNFELRGELHITKSQFDAINNARRESGGEEFSNSRNAVAGIARSEDEYLNYNIELTFSSFSKYENGKQVLLTKEDEDNGVISTEALTEEEIVKLKGSNVCIVDGLSFDSLKKAIDIFGTLRDSFESPTDGVVIKPINELEMMEILGFTSHHPIAHIAYKYPGSKVISYVEEITVSVGKTGKLTPRIRIKPVEIDGVIIEYVTGHNYNWIYEMGIRNGTAVLVTRANDVIPAIHSVVDYTRGVPPEVPTHCPECGELLEGDGLRMPKTLSCKNLSCPSRFFYYIKSIVGRNFLHIEGLGDKTIQALIDDGKLKSIVDLFTLSIDTIASTPAGSTSTGSVKLVGKGNAANIVDSINNAKLHTDSNKLLASLNFEGMGPNTAKRLIAKLGGIKQVLEADEQTLRSVDRVGDSLVNSIMSAKDKAIKELNELIELGVVINDPANLDESVGTFSVSGNVEGFANRADFVKHMETLGWEYHNSPRKDTMVLFADPNGMSAKIKNARKNGTRIIEKLEDL